VVDLAQLTGKIDRMIMEATAEHVENGGQDSISVSLCPVPR